MPFNVLPNLVIVVCLGTLAGELILSMAINMILLWRRAK